MKIKPNETFKGYDFSNSNKNRKPLKTYRANTEYEVHAEFGDLCVNGKLAIEVKSTEKKVDKKPVKKEVSSGKKTKVKKGKNA